MCDWKVYLFSNRSFLIWIENLVIKFIAIKTTLWGTITRARFSLNRTFHVLLSMRFSGSRKTRILVDSCFILFILKPTVSKNILISLQLFRAFTFTLIKVCNIFLSLFIVSSYICFYRHYLYTVFLPSEGLLRTHNLLKSNHFRMYSYGSNKQFLNYIICCEQWACVL